LPDLSCAVVASFSPTCREVPRLKFGPPNASSEPIPGNLGAMTIPSEHVNPPAQPEDADTSLLPPEARATVAEIKAENAALKMDDRIAEVEAEAIEEQAKQLVEVTEEVLEELQEHKQAANPG
jgi:hypothetical protein